MHRSSPAMYCKHVETRPGPEDVGMFQTAHRINLAN